MDKLRQRSKKDKPPKHVERDKPPLYISDVKAIKENIKIKEILRTVKMNSSMRLKAPRGSKVMQNKDFHDGDDIFECTGSKEDLDATEIPSATNTAVILNNSSINNEEIVNTIVKTDQANGQTISEVITFDDSDTEDIIDETQIHPESDRLSETVIDGETTQTIPTTAPASSETLPQVKTRDRKLSLDQTMLSRREGLQSEWDLNSIGKSPLERKSSFFKKKLDSFFKNTTEIFKRQTSSRSQSSIQRRSSLSMSLQSLNEKCNCDFDVNIHTLHKHEDEFQGSATSLQSSTTPGRSSSSLSQSDRGNVEDVSEDTSLAGSRPLLVASQPIEHSNSIHSLNDAYLNSRAISMSSGLDSALGQHRRKANRSNRVTWLASEGLTNYLRRVIQDEKSREMQMCHSYQDFTTIPEDQNTSKTDSKGRRLSYQRAVSGEDPVVRYQDNSLRKKQIPENSEPMNHPLLSRASGNQAGGKLTYTYSAALSRRAHYEIGWILAEYDISGVPRLTDYPIRAVASLPNEYLQWAESPKKLSDLVNWTSTPEIQYTPNEELRLSAIRELVVTEADYIKHLRSLADVFIGTAHALQKRGKLLNINTSRLFTNIPDVLNANLFFWENTIFPMLENAVVTQSRVNATLMAPGFFTFGEVFEPYEAYMNEHPNALAYLRSLDADIDFMAYLTWCHGHKACDRLQLTDIMVKPMQRLTKYSLLLRRIANHTEHEPDFNTLIAMETTTKAYVLNVNRTLRKRQELEMLEQLQHTIEPYEVDFKDEDLEKCFRTYSVLTLMSTMARCRLGHFRSIVHQGDLRFKDHIRESSRSPWSEVRVFLLTDMIIICKKSTKPSRFLYKMIRPKYMLNKITIFQKNDQRSDGLQALILIMVDEAGSSNFGFALTHNSKDTAGVIKIWEQKLREAMLTYEIGVWLAKDPSRKISDIENEIAAAENAAALDKNNPASKEMAEDLHLEKEAVERVAVMLHKMKDDPTEKEANTAASSFDENDSKRPTMQDIKRAMRYNSLGGSSSRNSRVSSFNKSSSSGASHEDPQPGPSNENNKAGASVEYNIPALGPVNEATSITVNVEGVYDSENPSPQQAPPPPPPRAVSPLPIGVFRNTLRVQPQSGVMALVHSLPDLTIDAVIQAPRQPPRVEKPLTASEKLYKSHNELLERNRLAAAKQQYLSPDQRGSSYPPPSPTRALKRGLAFSYTLKNPPLSKMGHVNSQSQTQLEPVPSTSQGASNDRRAPSPLPSTSTANTEKKSKIFRSGRSASPNTKTEDNVKDSKPGDAEKPDKNEKSDKKGKGKSTKGVKADTVVNKDKGGKGENGDVSDKADNGD